MSVIHPAAAPAVMPQTRPAAPRRVAFMGEDKLPAAPPPKTGRLWGYVQKAREYGALYAAKVTDREQRRQSFRNGLQAAKHSWTHDFRQATPARKALRLGLEALGLVVFIVCGFLMTPGPNPGFFISPTLFSFLKGFLKPTQPTQPKTLPAPDAKPDADAGDQK